MKKIVQGPKVAVCKMHWPAVQDASGWPSDLCNQQWNLPWKGSEAALEWCGGTWPLHMCGVFVRWCDCVQDGVTRLPHESTLLHSKSLQVKGGYIYGSANWFFSLSNQDFAFRVIWKTLHCKLKKKYSYMLFSTPVAMETIQDGHQTTFSKIHRETQHYRWHWMLLLYKMLL